ncbi:MAG: acetyl-CoA carboxylase biotin carboxyl carrier protein subunit [Fidelibacterota bacterium]
MKAVIVFHECEYEFHIDQNSSELHIYHDGKQLPVDCVKLTEGLFSVLINGKSHIVKLHPNDSAIELMVGQQKQQIRFKDEICLLLEKFGYKSHEQNLAGEIHVPIPGLLSRVFVKPGDKVEKGMKLAILEAMKMENEISSPYAGTVKKCHISEGTAVEKGELIMEIEI